MTSGLLLWVHQDLIEQLSSNLTSSEKAIEDDQVDDNQ